MKNRASPRPPRPFTDPPRPPALRPLHITYYDTNTVEERKFRGCCQASSALPARYPKLATTMLPVRRTLISKQARQQPIQASRDFSATSFSCSLGPITTHCTRLPPTKHTSIHAGGGGGETGRPSSQSSISLIAMSRATCMWLSPWSVQNSYTRM